MQTEHQNTTPRPVAASPQGVSAGRASVVFDRAGAVLACNPAWNHLAGKDSSYQARTRAGFARWLDTGHAAGVWEVLCDGSASWRQSDPEAQQQGERAHTLSLLDALIQQLPSIISVKDGSNHRYVLCNNASELTIGKNPVGKTCFDVFERSTAEHIYALDNKVLETGETTTVEAALVKSLDGIERTMRTKRFVVCDADGARFLVTLAEDISERHAQKLALEEAILAARTANEAKSTFLATMSHEIRTPLNGVLGMVQAMALDPLSPIQRGRLDVIRESGETLLAILNDVLDLSKIEAGKLTLEEVEFDFDELARGAHAAYTTLANKKGISFSLAVKDAKGIYLGDPTRLRQIVYNLVSNALKFTSSGEIGLKAGFDGKHLILSVTDTGIGMAPDVLTQLFTKFSQGDASTTRRYGGTGLGLAICKELAELMGGDVSASSIEGQGSTFTIRLPLIRIGDAASPAEISHVEADQLPDRPEPSIDIRVLAAEDNTVNQLVLKTLLHQAGIDPVIVDDGLKAVAEWRSGAYDVILMDVQMPNMDGLNATRAIRAEEVAEGRARTPIIALTANAMSHQITEYIAAGMDGFVAKPIETAKLFKAIEAALTASGERQAA